MDEIQSSNEPESEEDAPPRDAPAEPTTRTTRSQTVAPPAPPKSSRKKPGPGRDSVPNPSKIVVPNPKKRKHSEVEPDEPDVENDESSDEEDLEKGGNFMKLRRGGRGEAKGKETSKLIGSVPALDHQRLGSATKAMSSIVSLQFSLLSPPFSSSPTNQFLG